MHDVPDAAQERSVCAQSLCASVLLLSVRRQGVEQAEALSDLQLQNQERYEAVCALDAMQRWIHYLFAPPALTIIIYLQNRLVELMGEKASL